MDQHAVAKAQRKLQKLDQALNALEASDTADKAEAAWSDFLMASASIFNTVEKGAKGHGKSEAWLGRKKYERRKDGLLRYLHFARNAEEHGVERVITSASTNIKLASPGAWVKLESDGISKWTVVKSHGTIIYAADVALLKRVFDDRFNDFADPPIEHFRMQIECKMPLDAARLSRPYFERLIQEAVGLLAP